MRITKENPSIPTDEGTMLGWFANAIMAGYDHAKNDGRIAKLQSTITAQEGLLRNAREENQCMRETIIQQERIIDRLRRNSLRLATNYKFFEKGGRTTYCRYCGFIMLSGGDEKHQDDCPITLHTQLMNELGERQ
jgi:hypothetical protein